MTNILFLEQRSVRLWHLLHLLLTIILLGDRNSQSNNSGTQGEGHQLRGLVHSGGSRLGEVGTDDGCSGGGC